MNLKNVKKFICFISLISFGFMSITEPVSAAIRKLNPENFDHMYYFASQGRLDVLSEAVHRGLNIDAVNSNGDTGLCVAVKRKNARAFNTFVAAGANEHHPCTHRIPYYDDFVNSGAVQSGYLWSKEDYSSPVYHFKKKDNTWQWVGLLALVGGGAALLLSGGGGGGSNDDGGSDTPGLSCEYGCAEYDSTGKCIRCNEQPEDDCTENPCAEGCYTDIQCAENQVCVSQNSCGGCEECGPSSDCTENPCAEGCYTNIQCAADEVCTSSNECGGCEKCESKCTQDPCAEGCYTNIQCPEGQVCSSLNECGGCEACIAVEDNPSNFVIESDEDVVNTQTLTNEGSNKDGTWGGIFLEQNTSIDSTKQASLINSGDIVLSGGTDGVGIMSATYSDTKTVLSSTIKNSGKNITNRGDILITADESYGIFASTLGKMDAVITDGYVTGYVITLLNTLESEGSIHTQGNNNNGIFLLGNGNLNNSGSITLEGTATAGNFSNSYIYGYNISYILPSPANTGIYFATDLIDDQRGYDVDLSLPNKIENSGVINVNLTSDDQLTSYWSEGNNLTVSGFSTIMNPKNETDQFTVNNSGDINVNFTFNDAFFESMDLASRGTSRKNYFISGMTISNKNFTTSSDNEPTIAVTNRGNITLSGNGYMHGAIVDGVQFNNYGDILVNMSSSYTSSATFKDFEAIGILANKAVINQYGNIDYTSTDSGQLFYSLLLGSGTTVNVQSGATVKGNVVGGNTINNSGNLEGSSINSVYQVYNNSGGVIKFNTADVSILYNSGDLSIVNLAGSDIYGEASKVFVNESGANAYVSRIGKADSYADVKTRYKSVINKGILQTSLIATEEFENEGVINTDELSYYSFATNGSVDLRNVQFDDTQYINSGANGGMLELNSLYHDAFRLGDITVNQNTNAARSSGGTVVLYKDWHNENASEESPSSLELGNIYVRMSKIADTRTDDLSVGVDVSRNYVDVTSNKQIIMQVPNNITAIQLNGEGNNLVNDGDMSVTGLENAIEAGVGSTQVTGVDINGAGSSFINNGNIIVKNERTTFSTTETGNRFVYGVDSDGGSVTLSESSVINVSSLASGVMTYGVRLQGEAEGVNSGKITVDSIGGGVGVYALQTSSNGFENKGSIIVNSDNGIGMYANGYVDGTNDRYIKLINSGTITVNGSQGTGIYASGANSEVVNTGTITVDNPENNIVLENGAQLINDGTMSTAAAFNIDDITANGGSFVAGKTGVLQAQSVSGTMYAAANITLGSNDDTYTKEQAVVSEDNRATLLSQSVMFTADFQNNDEGGQDIVMNRKDFGELVSDGNLAQYLESNYQNGNGVTYFDDLKTAQNGTDLNSQIAGLTGQDVIPAFAYQDMERIRNINRTMADLMTDNKDNKEERVSVISDNYYRDIGNVGQVSGWEDSLFGISGLFDKKVNAKWRYGIGIGMYRAYTDFDNGAERTDNLFEIYNPYWFEGRKFGVLVMPYIGYANGDYERYENAKKYTGDIDSWYYGINNRVYGRYQLWGIQIEPRLELNINGVYTDKIKEDKGLTIDSRDTLSSEAGIGLYAEKKFDFNGYGNLDIGGGAMYYYELNSNAYKDIDAALYGMEGNYLLYGYNNRRSRGLISVKADYNIKGWSIYGNIMRMLERDDNMIYNAGIRYSF